MSVRTHSAWTVRNARGFLSCFSFLSSFLRAVKRWTRKRGLCVTFFSLKCQYIMICIRIQDTSRQLTVALHRRQHRCDIPLPRTSLRCHSMVGCFDNTSRWAVQWRRFHQKEMPRCVPLLKLEPCSQQFFVACVTTSLGLCGCMSVWSESSLLYCTGMSF